MNGFNITIKETTAELTPKMRVMLKDTTNAIKLDEIANDTENLVKIQPKDYAILAVHNEKSDNKDYELYLIIDRDGTKYVTGSPSFWNAFLGIFEELADETEPWSIVVYKRDSKNYKGKQFLTCSLC